MASLKIKYRHSSIEGKAGTLFYQVIHNRVARQINSGYKIYPDEWDIFNSQIIIPAKTGENRHRYLVSLKKCIKEDTSRLKDIMIRFENLGYKYTADEIIEYYSAPPVNEYFVSFCENLIEQLRQIGKMRTTETYTTTLNSFKRFMHSQKRDRDIPFDNVDSNLMIEYEQYLKFQDICPNSTSYYMRNLRAMYNRAVEKELVIQRYPFKHVYTGIDKTIKRAVPAKIIRQIRDMDLSHDSSLEYARDLFMFSFYTRGMSFTSYPEEEFKALNLSLIHIYRMENGEKIHVQTLAGLAHYDRDQRHSYEEIFRIMRQMNLPYPSQEELYRRMVFNVMGRNHDDHSKNFSFLMDRQGKWKLSPAYDLCYSYTLGGKWTNRHQLSLNGKQDNFTMEDLQKVGENMGIREHKQIIEKVQETVSYWHETAKDCGVKPEHADFIGKNLLLFGKQLHTIQMPDIANEQEQAFMKAMRNDDFNAILELKMKGYQPSEKVLKILQPDISATTFIAAAKIFQMEEVLKSIQDIKPAQSPIIGGNKRSMELGD